MVNSLDPSIIAAQYFDHLKVVKELGTPVSEQGVLMDPNSKEIFTNANILN